MANTFTQIFIHVVFSVSGRWNLINEKYRIELEKYITGIIKNHHSKPLAIYCNPDHTHILIGLHPNTSVSDMVRIIKTNSSKWINSNNWFNVRFEWQKGFGAFTYSKSQVSNVVNYILNQKEHHKKRTFREEYIELLKKFEIDYDEKYLFKWIEK